MARAVMTRAVMTLAAVAAATLGLAWRGPARADDPAPLRHHMIVAANPLAAEAGLSVLRAGGSAVDAAIAAQMVLTLVEPQATGIGGGALLLHFDAATGTVSAWDGRETAPAAANQNLFLDRRGKPMPYAEAGVGGRAVGVPGVLPMLEAAHKEFGKLPWDRLFTDAIRLADDGVPVPRRMAEAIVLDADALRRRPATHGAFFNADDTPRAAGTNYVNKPLAEMFRAIARNGASALLAGPIAADIATAAREDPNPGLLTADDLAAYQPRRRAPVCGPYRGHRMCGFGPPSAGGVAVLQTLGMLQRFDMAALAPPSGGVWGADAAELLLEAERLAHADRLRYLADSDRVPVPLRGLLAPDYIARRSALIDPEHANPDPLPGNPSWDGAEGPGLAAAPPQPEHGTSEIAVIDDAGNAVSMTTTVQDRFGSRLMVHGFILNDELTDFSFPPSRDGVPIANRVEAGKRPRSSMSPTFVFDGSGRLEYVVGSVGGAEIVAYVAQALVELLDFHASPQAATATPHITTRGDAVEVESGTDAAALAPALEARGEKVLTRKEDSGTMVIAVTLDGSLMGGADPRRDGVALGD